MRFAIAAIALAFASAAAAQGSELSITRFDCGTARAPIPVNTRFSDTWAYGDLKLQFVYSCYLIRDIFGDGTVMMLYTPGHTPGHHSLLVRLKQMGPVILVGDAAHFHENYDSNGVPSFNYDRAQTIASLDRIKKIVGTQKATVVIQHDARDVSKLPVAPESAK